MSQWWSQSFILNPCFIYLVNAALLLPTSSIENMTIQMTQYFPQFNCVVANVARGEDNDENVGVGGVGDGNVR
jgi:hypothetical protein